MFALYRITHPSVDDFQRFVYNIPKRGGLLALLNIRHAPPAGGGATSANPDNLLLRSDTRLIFETVQDIVETQITSWNMYLQYTAAIAISLFVVSLVLVDGSQTITQGAFPIIATIVGAVIGNAIQPSRSRTPPRETAVPASPHDGEARPAGGQPGQQPGGGQPGH